MGSSPIVSTPNFLVRSWTSRTHPPVCKRVQADLNRRPAELQSAALPLSYTPVTVQVVFVQAERDTMDTME